MSAGHPRSRRLRVLALAPYPEEAPSTRVRVAQFLPGLAALGIDVTLHSFVPPERYGRVRGEGAGRGTLSLAAGALAGLVRALRRPTSWDAVWIQRGVAPGLDLPVARFLEATRIPIVFDFDDAVHLPQEGGRRWVEALRRPGPTTAELCRVARVVLAGNDYLADFARGSVGTDGAARVRVLPSVVDTRRLVPVDGRPPGPPRLGWAGTDTTVPYLEGLSGPLAELARRVDFRMVVLAGARRPGLPEGIEVEGVRWSFEREAADLGGLDVGLYPLDDTPWSRGKCGYKALQYMACGVPCVASPVGVLPGMVVPGETGFLASRPEEWVESCARLLSDPELRFRMGAAGRTLVEARYSVDAALPELADALRSAAREGGDR